MGQVPTPVTVITAVVDEKPMAVVIGSFVSVSLDPPLVGFFAISGSGSWQQLKKATRLGVNVLAGDQEDVSRACTRPFDERLEGLDWQYDHEVPKIAGTSAWIVMNYESITKAGDHDFALCNVEHMSAAQPAKDALLYTGGYRQMVPKS